MKSIVSLQNLRRIVCVSRSHGSCFLLSFLQHCLKLSNRCAALLKVIPRIKSDICKTRQLCRRAVWLFGLSAVRYKKLLNCFLPLADCSFRYFHVA